MENKDLLEKAKLTNNVHFHRHDIADVIGCLGRIGFSGIKVHRLLDRYEDRLIVEARKA